MFSGTSVCLSVCEILKKLSTDFDEIFCVATGRVPRNNRLHFVGDYDHYPDHDQNEQISFKKILHLLFR